jgi:hypothetical protein
VAVARNTLDEA